MKATLRFAFRVAALVALASITLAGVASAAGPTVGGRLDAYADRSIVVTSNGNVPAHVVMSADAVTLSEVTFDLLPGQSHRLSYSGGPAGQVIATYTIIPTDGTESGSATLVLNLKPAAPITQGPLNGPLPLVLAALAVGVLVRLAVGRASRAIRRRYRIVRVS